MSSASKRGTPHAAQTGPCTEGAARTIQRVSAVEGAGDAAIRSSSAVTPDSCAAKVSLRLPTRSSFCVSPHTSSTTAPSASQASASAAMRKAASTSGARTVTRQRGSKPSSANPLGDSAPVSRSAKSCRIQTSGRRAATRPARPKTKPVAVALCRPPSANTSCSAPMARPPCNIASASAWPSATRRASCAPSPVSRRAMRVRKCASVLMRAPVMCAAPSRIRSHRSLREPRTDLLVHGMF
jgi:hypothetical protein